MSNTIFITANWTTGALSQQTISRQYDNNRYAVQFIGYPEGDGTEELDLYLLVWMSTAPGQKPGEITPIQLNSDQWYISNYFTQQVQVIKFQLCVLNEAGTYEAHSPIFSGRIGDSLEHDGTSHDIDVSTLFDAYREYIEELIIGAGAVIIDPVPTQGSTNAVQSGGVYSALAGKVDAVSGKGLSANDYSDAEKQKVTDATADLSAMATATAEDVGKALKAKAVSGGKVTEWEFGETVDTDLIDKITERKNLFDAEVATDGYRIDVSGANLAGAEYYISDYIPVTTGVTYSKNSPALNAYHRLATYNNSKTFVRAIIDTNSITVEDGEAYIRFCGLLTEKDTATFYEDDWITAVDRTARDNISEIIDEIGTLPPDMTPKNIKSAIFNLLLNAAYINENDRSEDYNLLRDWSITTPTKYGGLFYSLLETTFSGNANTGNNVVTDFIPFNIDRDFTIAIDFSSTKYAKKQRLFGAISSVDSVAHGIAVSVTDTYTFKVLIGSSSYDTNPTYSTNHGNGQGRIRFVFRHKKGTQTLKLKHGSTVRNETYDEEFEYIPDPLAIYPLIFGSTNDFHNYYNGTIFNFGMYDTVWTDAMADKYVEGAL